MLDLKLDRFRLGGDIPTGVSGTASWQDAAITSPVAVVLGDLEIVLESRDAMLVGAVTRGGELGISGDFSLLAGGRYTVNLVLRPGKNVGSETLGLLETVMQAGPGGGYLLSTSGSY